MNILVLRGEGINCERESARAFERLGAKTTPCSVRDLVRAPTKLLQASMLVFPGGFSYGDEMQSGHVLGLALKEALKEVWPAFLARGGLVIGVCNGFQTLMKMGVFEAGPRTLALAHNESHQFIDRWVSLEVRSSRCIWTRGLEGRELVLPSRHGEGRIWSETTSFEMLDDLGQVPLRYRENINGSMGRIAGLCDPSGQILGMMPHPEAALDEWLFPAEYRSPEKAQLNALLFQNALKHLQGASL